MLVKLLLGLGIVLLMSAFFCVVRNKQLKRIKKERKNMMENIRLKAKLKDENILYNEGRQQFCLGMHTEH